MEVQDEAGAAVMPPIEALLDPEIMSTATLWSVLSSRGIPVPPLTVHGTHVHRDDLVRLYKEHALPKPQREPRARRERRSSVKRAAPREHEDEEDGDAVAGVAALRVKSDEHAGPSSLQDSSRPMRADDGHGNGHAPASKVARVDVQPHDRAEKVCRLSVCSTAKTRFQRVISQLFNCTHFAGTTPH